MAPSDVPSISRVPEESEWESGSLIDGSISRPAPVVFCTRCVSPRQERRTLDSATEAHTMNCRTKMASTCKQQQGWQHNIALDLPDRAYSLTTALGIRITRPASGAVGDSRHCERGAAALTCLSSPSNGLADVEKIKRSRERVRGNGDLVIEV